MLVTSAIPLGAVQPVPTVAKVTLVAKSVRAAAQAEGVVIAGTFRKY